MIVSAATRYRAASIGAIVGAATFFTGCAPSGGGDSFLSSAAESSGNYGLGVINADSAYAAGASGAGVVVAVIDSGIDTFHPDLDNNISPSSIDIVDPNFPLRDDAGHGTQVAGVIAAERNGFGMHGVAPEATILAIRADGQSGLFFDSDLTNALNYAVGRSADVINLSLGGPSPNSLAFEQALINATSAGVVVVAATGNESRTAPGFPAAYAGDPALGGLAIAVGSVDQSGQNLSSFSNWCGASLSFCLVAPGEAILTTAAGGGFTRADGTSFAAPHVSGAAALLLDLFPNLTPQQVVQILLVSATDLGTPGVDAVYGRGLLNLDRAVAPLGTLAVPLADSAAGETAALSETRLALGPAFGDALSGIAVLGSAVAIDDFDRPYSVDLSAAVSPWERTFRLSSLLADSETGIVSIPSPGGLTLHMAVTDGPDSTPWLRSGLSEPDGDVEAVSLAGALSPDTEWRLGLGLSAEGQFDRGTATPAADSLFWAAGEMTSPHYALLGSGNGVRLDQSISDTTTLSVGWFESDAVENSDTDLDWGGGNIIQAAVDHSFADGGTLRLGVARVEESDTFLGSQTGGAFGSGAGATSHFVTVSGGLPITGMVDLIGSVTTGTTDVGDAGLLRDWETVRSTAFGVGAVARDVFDSGDRVGLLAGQPLRVDHADVTLAVPVGMTADETMIRNSQRVDLSPSGRELNLQLAYDRPLWEGANLSSWLMMRTEPGHDAAAANDYGMGLSFKMAF